MLSLLSLYSRGRFAWFLLFLSTAAFEITSIYFQYVLGLAPCTLCIYQRSAMFGILLASLIGLSKPHRLLFRCIAILLWLASAFKGFELALFHSRLQFEPNFTDTCAINVEFPNWLPLNKWLPQLFNAYGYCTEKIWSFLTIEMSQWMMIIFAGYFAVGACILVSQIIPPAPKNINKW